MSNGQPVAHADHAAPAKRPARREVADILRERADAYGEAHRLSARQQRVVGDLEVPEMSYRRSRRIQVEVIANALRRGDLSICDTAR